MQTYTFYEKSLVKLNENSRSDKTVAGHAAINRFNTLTSKKIRHPALRRMERITAENW